MIPTSLKIALLVGIFSGAAVSLILVDIRDSDIQYVEGPSLTLHADRSDYTRGQPVFVDVINTGSVLMHLDPFTVSGLDGTLLFSEDNSTYTLEPGKQTVITWDQKNTFGRQVFDGIYRISVTGMYGDMGIRGTAVVDIIQGDLTFGS